MTFKYAVDRLWSTDINDKIRELLYDTENYEEEVTKLFDEKVRLADEIIENYVARTGERPDGRQLSRLASWIDKYADTDIEVLSPLQLKRRRAREISVHNIDYKIRRNGNRRIEPRPTDADGGNHHYSIKK